MMCAWVIAIATFATGVENGNREMRVAFGTLQRLAAAIPAERPELTAQERAEHGPAKAELEALMIYLTKVNEVMETGYWNENYHANYLTVVHQTVNAGRVFAVLPEEALCWERAGLNIAATHLRLVRQQHESGKLSKQALFLASASHQRARKSYLDALARCIQNLD